MPVPSARSRSDTAAAERWSERLARFAAGGQTITAFCAAEGISESNFYLWKRRPARSPGESAPIVPLRVAPPPAPVSPIELALPSGAVLRLPADTRPGVLVTLLRGLEDRPC